MSAFYQYDRLPGNDQLCGYTVERQRAWKLELILCWLDSCAPGLRKATPVQGNLRRRSLRVGDWRAWRTDRQTGSIRRGIRRLEFHPIQRQWFRLCPAAHLTPRYLRHTAIPALPFLHGSNTQDIRDPCRAETEYYFRRDKVPAAPANAGARGNTTQGTGCGPGRCAGRAARRNLADEAPACRRHFLLRSGCRLRARPRCRRSRRKTPWRRRRRLFPFLLSRGKAAQSAQGFVGNPPCSICI